MWSWNPQKSPRREKKRRKETPRKDSWLSNGHFRPRAAQINLIYGEISSLSSQFFTVNRFLGKTRLKPFHWAPWSNETVSTIWLFYWILIQHWRQFNGHFSIRQCKGGMKALIRETSFFWRKKMGKMRKKLIFSGRSLCRRPIFTVGMELEAEPYHRKRTKKRRSKNKVKKVKKDKVKKVLETLETVFPEEKAIFSFCFPLPRPLMGKRYKI